MSFRAKPIGIYVSVLLLFSACGIDPIENENSNEFPQSDKIVNCSITGKVLDADEKPLEGVSVQLITSQETTIIETDKNGNFLIENISNNGESGFLSFKYPNKFTGFKRLALIEGKHSYTQVMLQEKKRLGTIDSNQGGKLSASDGSSIELPSNGIVDASGNDHGGVVNVYMNWIDPSSASLGQLFVGDRTGIDIDGEIQSLVSYGMLRVELEDDNGNALNIKEGHKATLDFPVPTTMLSKAPDDIPLWSFDETEGYWVEDGEASLANGKYKGEVSHFSTWNVDVKFNPMDLCGQVILNFGQSSTRSVGASFYKTLLSNSEIGSIGGWLSDDGQFKFLNLPKGEVFLLEIFDLCGEVIYSDEIGSYEEDAVLDDIFINAMQYDFRIISGNGIDCNSELILDGLVTLQLDDNVFMYPLNNDGQFNFPVPICENFAGTITVIDRQNTTMSEPILVTESDSLFEFTDIYVCQELENYFRINLEGVLDTILLQDISWGTWFQDDSLGNVLGEGVAMLHNSGMSFQMIITFKGDGTKGEVADLSSIEIIGNLTTPENYKFVSKDAQAIFTGLNKGHLSGTVNLVTYFQEDGMWQTKVLDEEIEVSGSWSTE